MATATAIPTDVPETSIEAEGSTEVTAAGLPIFHSRVHIAVGDLVILYMNRESMVAITVTPGGAYHNKFGRYVHDEMIGMKFGSKMHSPAPHSGYIHLLRPTPELWTLSLPHRTQILYFADIAYISSRLGIRPGGKVIEAGTGSGSMTHSLSRSVGLKGTVLSYEFNEMRYEKAKEEFDSHALRNVRLQHRNVCKDGFGDAENVEAAPWEAVPHAVKVLRPDTTTRICCFSPCIEQVIKTVSTLRSEGFTDISTQEALFRTHEIQAPPEPRSVSFIVSQLRNQERSKEERRLVQMRTARERMQRQKEATSIAEASSRSDGAAEPTGDAQSSDAVDLVMQEEQEMSNSNGDIGSDRATKRRRIDGNATTHATNASDMEEATTSTTQIPIKARNSRLDSIEELERLMKVGQNARPPLAWTEPPPVPSGTTITKPSAEMRGHTSYLTFGTFYPASIRASLAERENIAAGRVGKLRAEASSAAASSRAESLEGTEVDEGTDYGDDGMDNVLGTMTEEEMLALGGA